MRKKKPTIHEISKALGISSATVSRALNNSDARISKETRKKVKKMAEKMGYQPNIVAASLRKGHSNIVGIIVPFADRYFFSSIIRGVEEELKKHDYNVIICQSYESLQNEKDDINTLLSAQVAGILISPSRETEEVDHLINVMERGKTLIMFDRTISDVPAPSVAVDDYHGAYNMVSNLIQSGRKRIAFFTGNQNVSVFRARQRGYISAMTEHGLEIPEEFMVRVRGFRENGVEATAHLMSLDHKPDAIFSVSDFSAFGAMQWLIQNGYNIPEDICVAGFGNDPFTDFITPTMSSIDQKSQQMGKAAAQLFLEEMNEKSVEPKRLLLTPEIVLRDSTLHQNKVIA